MTLDAEARQQAKAAALAAVDSATRDLDSGVIEEVEWQQRVSNALGGAYLLDDDLCWQSGFDGDPGSWREARELVLDAVGPRHAPSAESRPPGTFLDVGCATGYLMECLEVWAAERGLQLEAHGLELDGALARAAKARRPDWSARIFEGNVSEWVAPRPFDYVRTGLEYVHAPRQAALLRRLAQEVVTPGGRLIVGPVSEGDLEGTRSAFREAFLTDPAIENATDRNGKTRYVLWIATAVRPEPAASDGASVPESDNRWPRDD
jgi:SAM-dependent methyltransferase